MTVATSYTFPVLFWWKSLMKLRFRYWIKLSRGLNFALELVREILRISWELSFADNTIRNNVSPNFCLSLPNYECWLWNTQYKSFFDASKHFDMFMSSSQKYFAEGKRKMDTNVVSLWRLYLPRIISWHKILKILPLKKLIRQSVAINNAKFHK